MKLLIVESPAKAKKIQGYLGAGWKVLACLGHVRDLPASKEDVPDKHKGLPWARLGINVEEGYAPLYVTRKGKSKTIQELKAAAKRAEQVFLAADPDREGESIAWHLSVLLGLGKNAQRITYQEITQAALRKAVEQPRPIDFRLVAAQETRRALDRLAGYGVSPLLWASVGGAQSAGRVQSAALMLLAQREQARLAFVPAGYWRVTARVGSQPPFQAVVVAVRDTPLATAASFDAQGQVKAGLNVMQLDAVKAEQLVTYLNRQQASVQQVEVTPVTRKPPAPFTTSTLQQAANARLKLGAAEVTKLAQSLYEGGFLTYIRTDSPALSDEALQLAREAVATRFGRDALPPSPRQYATRNANAQEAHEAIRPAGKFLPPADTGLAGDELALYTLVYERTLASQMRDALGEKTSIVLQAGVVTLAASGTRLLEKGFTALYDDTEKDEEDQVLPTLTVGAAFPLSNAKAEEKRSTPPARHTEGKFVQLMEKAGIGRPSTYGNTLDTLLKRGYIAVRNRQLHVTPLGLLIAGYLLKQVPQLVDVKFTATMEADLDRIAEGALTRTAYLDAVWKEQLAPAIDRAARTPPRVQVPHLPAVFEARAGQVYLNAQGRAAPVPEGLLPEDLTEQAVGEVLAGTWKGPRKGRASGADTRQRAESGKQATGGKRGGEGRTSTRKRASGTQARTTRRKTS
ncbi:type I DNA topoisomerase [Deinococcus aluminii]|uniref:DNA topoisomerase 1 n=1 Tax=Deinococcus aluminii TaxID=1656885 RepID=A0ABP9XH13_9DEIO